MPDYGRPIEFGIFLDPAAAQSATVLDTIALIDQLGFDWIGVQDHPYNRTHLDAMTLIGMGLARTERVRFLPDVASLPLRPPAMLANQAVTLDLLGNHFDLYDRYTYFDAIPHAHGTGAATVVAAQLGDLPVLSAVGAAQIGHIALEAQEYYSDVLFGLRNVRGTWDTVNDLLAGAVGSLLYASLLRWWRGR